MTYRILAPEEWPKLVAAWPEYATYIPDPASATCAVAENELGEIIGVLFLQIAIHMEPLVLKSPHVNFLRLRQEVLSTVAERKGLTYYSFSDQAVVEGMLKKAGMKRLPFNSVWSGEV